MKGCPHLFLELPHFERVHALRNTRDLQRTICVFSILEEQHDLLLEWTRWEGEGDVRLSA